MLLRRPPPQSPIWTIARKTTSGLQPDSTVLLNSHFHIFHSAHLVSLGGDKLWLVGGEMCKGGKPARHSYADQEAFIFLTISILESHLNS